MPLKQHPTDPDKVVYASRHYDIPQLQGVTTTQRPWVGLTAEEILDLFDATNVYGSKWIEFAREIEQLLKEKNT
jgi:hypothetical protein